MALKTVTRADRRRGQGKLYVVGFASLVVLFAWHNATSLSAIRGNSVGDSSYRVSRKRSSLEGTGLSSEEDSLNEDRWSKEEVSSDGGSSIAAAGSHTVRSDLEKTEHRLANESQQEPEDVYSKTSSSSGHRPEKTGSGVHYDVDSVQEKHQNKKSVEDPLLISTSKRGSVNSSQAEISTTEVKEQEQQQQSASKSASKSTQTGVAPPPPVQLEEVLHTPPQAVQAAAHLPTLVLYIYFATDFEHEERFQYFVRAGIAADDGVAYRVVVADPGSARSLGTFPRLPSNGKYLLPARNTTCTSTWGAIASVQQQIALTEYEFIVVVDSHVLGPLLPSYATSAMHWTEILTGKLSQDTKLVGSFISCEGTPKHGVPAQEWRLNPYVLPHTWATDKLGWELLASNATILQCYDGYWETRYNSDMAASLVMLNAGYNIDSLLLRYEGVDWRKKENWDCNARIRPDRVNLYDGIMASPYEVIFLPLSMAEAQHRLMLRAASRYAKWSAPKDGAFDISQNAYWSRDFEGDWSVRGRKVIALLRRWSCFDDEYYLKTNPDVRTQLNSMGGDAVAAWEHFVTLGQFQGRVHRFVCGDPILSKEDAVKVLLQRGRACFDHMYYKQQYTDLGNYSTQLELWLHYVKYGQFENRTTRFLCPESIDGLRQGYDGTSAAQLDAESQMLLRRFMVLLKSQSSIDNAIDAVEVVR